MSLDTKQRSISLFWLREKNFGDVLNQVLLPHFGIPVLYCEPAKADATGIGSILDLVPASFAGMILGSGLMREHNGATFVNAKHLVVRGRLTARLCNSPGSTLIGDPGLLAGRVFRPNARVRYTLGIVPHYVDWDHPAVTALLDRYPRELKIIDVRSPSAQVVSEIAECECIVSSSLHGLVAADALGKPNKWIALSDKVLGRGFKFRDYSSAFLHDETRRQGALLRGHESLSELKDGMYIPGNEVLDLIDRLYEFFSHLAQRI
jgi:pyruvyltransferase